MGLNLLSIPEGVRAEPEWSGMDSALDDGNQVRGVRILNNYWEKLKGTQF